MNYWFIPIDPLHYDVSKEFKEVGEFDQTQHVKQFEDGDIVYIYEGKPKQRITWKCRIAKVNRFFDILDENGNRQPPDEEGFLLMNGPFSLLKPICEFDKNIGLSLDDLKRHGLGNGKFTSIQSQRRVPDEVLEYILKIEEDNIEPLEPNYISGPGGRRITKITGYIRDPLVIHKTKERANGCCELCGKEAPFNDKNGNPFLETHHIVWLSAGGEDSINNTAALCPNCHRKIHELNDPKDVLCLQNLRRKSD
jgi:hypothetical protein